MKKKDKLDSENSEYWRFVRETAQEVSSWPNWMKDGLGQSSEVLLSTTEDERAQPKKSQ